MAKFYYGFRYFGGKNTTMGKNYRIAGEERAFKTQGDLNNWLYKEKLSSPSGLGGGERVQMTKSEIMKKTKMNKADFDLWIDLEMMKYE